MDWITALLWFCITGTLFVMAGAFLWRARKKESGSVSRQTFIALFIMFMIIGCTKLFDLLVVNLGGVPELIPLLGDVFVFDPTQTLYLGLLVMTLFLVGFSVLLFVLERHMIHSRYILTAIPLVVIVVAWIFTFMGYPVDLFFGEDFYQSIDALILLPFFICRAFIPFAYLYLIIKTSGIYRRKSLALFLGYGLITTFFVRFPGYEFLSPYLIIGGLIFIIWGHKEA